MLWALRLPMRLRRILKLLLWVLLLLPQVLVLLVLRVGQILEGVPLVRWLVHVVERFVLRIFVVFSFLPGILLCECGSRGRASSFGYMLRK